MEGHGEPALSRRQRAFMRRVLKSLSTSSSSSIEQLLHEATALLNAASLIYRIAQQS